MTKDVFCANCQMITVQDAEVDEHGDLILTCPCDRFIKIPADQADHLDDVLAEHHEANEGQVKRADQLAKFGLDDATETDTTAAPVDALVTDPAPAEPVVDATPVVDPTVTDAPVS